MSNRETLELFFAQNMINIRCSSLFDTPPPALPADLDWDRVEGMMLGLAVGDSLGNTSEGLLPASRQARFGEVRDYLPNEHAGRRRLGLPRDDTQLALWTLEQLLEDGRLTDSPDYRPGLPLARRLGLPAVGCTGLQVATRKGRGL